MAMRLQLRYEGTDTPPELTELTVDAPPPPGALLLIGVRRFRVVELILAADPTTGDSGYAARVAAISTN